MLNKELLTKILLVKRNTRNKNDFAEEKKETRVKDSN